MSGLLDQLNDTFGDKYPVVVAAVVGVISLSMLWCCLGLFGSSGETKDATDVTKGSEDTKESKDEDSKDKKPKGKGTSKVKQASKKVTLPSHPLLAGEFKGHTGAVLSIDMDSNGKYLASCSEGMPMNSHYKLTPLVILDSVFSLDIAIGRSDDSSLAHEDAQREGTQVSITILIVLENYNVMH